MRQRFSVRDYIAIVLSTLLLIDGIDNVFEYVVAFLLSLSFLRKPDGYIPLIWVSSWFSNMVVLPFIGAFFYYVILFVIASCLQHRFSNHTRLGKSMIVACGLFVVWIIVTLASTLVPEYDTVIKLAIYVLSFALICRYRTFDVSGVYECIVYVSIVCSIFFALRISIAPFIFSIDSFENISTNMASSTTIMPDLNPNTAGQFMALLSIVLFCTAISRKKYLLLFPLMLNFYVLIELGSRTSFFTLLFICGIYVLFIYKKNLIRIIVLLFLAVFLYFVFMNVWGEAVSNSRIMNDSILGDDGNGRFVQWASLFKEVLPHYWISGIGIGRESFKALGFVYDADNIYIDLLCQIGVIGFLLFFFIYCKLFRSTYISMKSNPVYQDFTLMFMIAFLFMGIGETVFTSPIYWATLMLVAVLGNSSIKRKKYRLLK